VPDFFRLIFDGVLLLYILGSIRRIS